MEQTITNETITYVAALAKRHLNEEDRETARDDMQKMLDYVDKLNDLDTNGIEPMSHVFPLCNVFREDCVTNGDECEAVLANAPQEEDDQFVVPITIE